MKHIYSLLIITLLLTSCGGEKKQSVDKVIGTNNLEAIKKKRAEVNAKQQEIASQLKLLDNKILELDPDKNLPLVTTFTAKEEVFIHYLELQGNVTTKDLVIIYPEYSGLLTKVYVKEGQKVSKGQTLAKIDDGGLSQQLAQLQIQTNLAKTTFERQQRLWDQKIGSEIQYLQAKSTYQAQEKAVKQLQEQVEKTVVKAPFSGTIDDVITDQGSVVAPGQSPLMRIVNLNNMYIETDVPESHITSITKNKNVQIEFPVLDKKVEGKIRQASDYINPANRTFKIEIAVQNKDKTIKPNLTAKLKINDYTNDKALLIPQSIISENANGDQYIYILEKNTESNKAVAKQIIIETGKTQGDVVEVLSGLKTGNEIIEEGARSVKNGQKVNLETRH